MFDIIVPTFKTPLNLLKKCLDSIHNQIYTEYKVWICDGTPHEWKRYDAMMQLIGQYPNVEYVRQSGKGVSQARNQIIRMGNHPYVAFLDSDDEWDMEYLINMKEGIDNPNHDTDAIWFCEVKETTLNLEKCNLLTIGIDERVAIEQTVEKIIQSYEPINFLPPELHLAFHLKAPIWFTGAIIKREALEKTNLFDESYQVGEDTLLIHDILLQGYSTCFISFLGAYRNTHSNQLTQREDTKYWNDKVEERVKEYRPLALEKFNNNKTLTPMQKKVYQPYFRSGRTAGVSLKNCSTTIGIVDIEEYELQFL